MEFINWEKQGIYNEKRKIKKKEKKKEKKKFKKPN